MASDRHIKSLVEKGNNALKNKTWEEGLKIFKELAEIFQENAAALTNYSICLMNSSQYTKAKKFLIELKN